MHPVKTCILGVKGVGKTTLALQLSSGQTKLVTSKVGESCVINSMDVNFNGAPLQIWDTAGPKLDPDMKFLFHIKAQLAIIVYDITNTESFKALRNLVYDMKSNAHENCLVCIFGNKLDKADERVVSKERAQELAKSVGASFYFEISAKENQGITEAFTRIARILLIRYRTSGERNCKDIRSTDTNNVPDKVLGRKKDSCAIM